MRASRPPAPKPTSSQWMPSSADAGSGASTILTAGASSVPRPAKAASWRGVAEATAFSYACHFAVMRLACVPAAAAASRVSGERRSCCATAVGAATAASASPRAAVLRSRWRFILAPSGRDRGERSFAAQRPGARQRAANGSLMDGKWVLLAAHGRCSVAGGVMEFRILGPVEVLENGRAVSLGGRKQRAVLALLVLNANKVVSSERLIDLLWGERPPATAATALQGHVSGLRKALGAEAIATRRPGYVLDAEPAEIDLARFEGLRGEARRAFDGGDPGVASDKLREALALWRGDALADIAFEPSVHAEAARLEDLRLVALEDRIDADLALGRAGELSGELERLAAADPLRERLWAQLMLSLYRSGRQAEALDAYQRARRTLVSELGIEPGPALRDLERRILNQDPTLDLAESPPSAALEISLLGPPRVYRAGRPVSVDTRKATALLAHLALADRPRS